MSGSDSSGGAGGLCVEHERPTDIPISPSSSLTSQHCIMASRTNSSALDDLYDQGTTETDSGGLQCSSDYLSEDMKITALMAEYAERDKQYGGVPGQGSEDSSPGDGPPRPVLIPTSITESHETSKDGPQSIAKKIFTALRIKKGERNLSLASNGPPDDGPSCVYIYHHSGSPSPGMSLLSLNPDQSPRLSPLYTPDSVHYGEVISYLPPGQPEPDHTPGTDVIKLESKTHVYLALDYTDEDKPKLLAIEEKAMEDMLMKVNAEKTEQKIKPIVNSRTFPGPTQTVNDTAFYFKTEKNYHFIAVNDKTLSLEIKTIPVGKKTKDTYRAYLSFGPRVQKSCPRLPSEEVDAPSMKSAIPTSPLSDLGTDKADSDRSKKSSVCSSCGSTPSDAPLPSGGKLRLEGVDSGVDDGGPKDEVHVMN